MNDHMDCIDRNALWEQIRLAANRTSLGETVQSKINSIDIISIIKDMPSVCAPRGYWIPIYENEVLKQQRRAKDYECSVCHRTSSDDVYTKNFDFEYCPHCGTEMNEKEITG